LPPLADCLRACSLDVAQHTHTNENKHTHTHTYTQTHTPPQTHIHTKCTHTHTHTRTHTHTHTCTRLSMRIPFMIVPILHAPETLKPEPGQEWAQFLQAVPSEPRILEAVAELAAPDVSDVVDVAPDVVLSPTQILKEVVLERELKGSLDESAKGQADRDAVRLTEDLTEGDLRCRPPFAVGRLH